MKHDNELAISVFKPTELNYRSTLCHIARVQRKKKSFYREVMHAAKINAASPTQIRSGNSFINSIVKESITALCKNRIAKS